MQYRVRIHTLFPIESVRLFALLLSGSVFVTASFFMHEEISFRASDYYEIQIDLFIWLNQLLSDWPWFWNNVTEIGNAFVFIPLVSYLLIRRPEAWAALFGAVPLSSIFSIAGKHLTAIPRPAAVLPHDQFNIVGKVLMSHNSFPSGHSITAFAILTVVVLSHSSITYGTSKRLLFMGGFFFAMLIAGSRIAVGAHWPLDVVAGAILGIIGGISGLVLVNQYHLWWNWIESCRGRWLLSLTLLLWGIALVMDALQETHSGAPIFWLSALCALSVSALLVYNLLLKKVQPPRRIHPSH